MYAHLSAYAIPNLTSGLLSLCPNSPFHYDIKLARMESPDGMGCHKCFMSFIKGSLGVDFHLLRTIVVLGETWTHWPELWAALDFQLRARTGLAECYRTTVSIRTLPSGHSRLSWVILFLLGHTFELSDMPEWAHTAYHRAITISRAEKAAQALTGADCIATSSIRDHHRQCSEAALGWDPPDVILAEEARNLGAFACMHFPTGVCCDRSYRVRKVRAVLCPVVGRERGMEGTCVTIHAIYTYAHSRPRCHPICVL